MNYFSLQIHGTEAMTWHIDYLLITSLSCFAGFSGTLVISKPSASILARSSTSSSLLIDSTYKFWILFYQINKPYICISIQLITQPVLICKIEKQNLFL